MIVGVILAAAAAGVIPVTPAVERFPDPRWWPGAGVQQVTAMLSEIVRESSTEFVTSAPGPQQLRELYLSGRLDLDERVALLLGGAHFNHPSLLPAFQAAFRSEHLRERQAAIVGLAWLIGDAPPVPGAIPDRPETWESLARFAAGLEQATRTRTLVGIWVDSYLEARDLPRRSGLTLNRPPNACLNAIQQLASPDDLGEVAALWPFLADDRERILLVSVFEVITVREHSYRPRGPRAPTGGFLMESSISSVSNWLSWFCPSIDGRQFAYANAGQMLRWPGDIRHPAPWLRLLGQDVPFAWPLAAEMLSGFGAPAIHLNRRLLEFVDSSAERARMLDYFPITREAVRGRR